MMKIWLPKVDLGPVAMGVPKETSEKQMVEAKEAIAPLVATAASIIDDRLLLTNEYPEEDCAPVDPSVSP